MAGSRPSSRRPGTERTRSELGLSLSGERTGERSASARAGRGGGGSSWSEGAPKHPGARWDESRLPLHRPPSTLVGGGFLVVGERYGEREGLPCVLEWGRARPR
jgi:hypothetical protein